MKAATRLNVAQPTLSNAIHRLEKELGTTLFDRSGRNSQVTPQGMDFYYYVNESLTSLESGTKRIQTRPQQASLIRLGFFFSLGSQFIPEMISDYWQTYPNDQFTFIQKSSNELHQALKSQRCDLVICTLPSDNDPHLIYTPVLQQHFVVAVSDKHPLAKRHQVSLTELDGETLLSFPLKSRVRKVINNLLVAEHITPKQTIVFEEDRTMLGFVAQGIGYAILPSTEVTSFHGIKALALAEMVPPQSIFIGYPTELDHNPGLRRAVPFIKAYCQTHDLDSGDQRVG